MSTSIVVAINNTYSIGNEGKLMFKINKDLQRFKKLTLNNSIVMGRNTFEEISRALPKRNNIVLSNTKGFKPEGVTVENSFQKVLDEHLNKNEDLYIIGGQEIFNLGVKVADKVYLTLVDDDSYGDREFPYEYVKQHFKVVKSESHNEDGYNFQFIDYVRK